MSPLLALLMVACARTDAPLATPVPADRPAHPSEIVFTPYEFTLPREADHRFDLPSGVPVFFSASDELPLVELGLVFRGGAHLEAAGQHGIAELAAHVIRDGGTATLDPVALDERFAGLAAEVEVRVGPRNSIVTLDCLSDTFDEALALTLEMVRSPGFATERVELVRAQLLDVMDTRNDVPSDLVHAELQRLLFGDHPEAWQSTAAELEGITEDDLRAFHARIFHPGNLAVRISGDFDPDTLADTLERAFAGWEAGPPSPPLPAPTHTPVPGLYHVAADVPQANIRMGHIGLVDTDPDWPAVQVMTQIFGSPGFNSRLMSRVRSDEGLAYAASSSFQPGIEYPGAFRVGSDTKNPTVALTIQLVLEEMERMRTERVPAEELEATKSVLVSTFPDRFATRTATLQEFMLAWLNHRDESTLQTWRDKIAAVTAEDVLRVAKEHMRPDDLVVLVIGDWEAMAAGDPAGRARMEDLGDGTVTHLPARDPRTLKPIQNGAGAPR